MDPVQVNQAAVTTLVYVFRYIEYCSGNEVQCQLPLSLSLYIHVAYKDKQNPATQFCVHILHSRAYG